MAQDNIDLQKYSAQILKNIGLFDADVHSTTTKGSDALNQDLKEDDHCSSFTPCPNCGRG